MSDSNNSLTSEAQIAWEAYLSMSKTKTAYFSFLSEIDQKYKDGGSPTIAENLQLEKLLGIHNEAVAIFNRAMQSVTDKDAREQLLIKLTGDTGKQGTH
ncbi:MAG: hypothetical protein P8X93_09080 [Gammaproteobacteria bacterium]|jgi:hypothetical protein